MIYCPWQSTKEVNSNIHLGYNLWPNLVMQTKIQYMSGTLLTLHIINIKPFQNPISIEDHHKLNNFFSGFRIQYGENEDGFIQEPISPPAYNIESICVQWSSSNT